MKFDVVIVGAGPGGMFAAYKLAESKKVAIFEMGRDISKRKCPSDLSQSYCKKCNPCNITSGVGGAGGLSDGKLNYVNPNYPSSFTVGGDFEFLSPRYLIEKMKEVDEIFSAHGVSGELYGDDEAKLDRFLKQANAAGIEFVPLRQRHVGSDELPRVIKSLEESLKKKGVEIYTERTVLDIDPKNKIVKTNKGEKFGYEKLIIAVGRSGSDWLEKWVKKYKIDIAENSKAIDVGVRVEVPASIMDDITSTIYDPKLRVITKRHDDYMRTFCTCPRGWVIREDYGDFCLVNGHSKAKEKSNNTNFALLGHYEFTEPFDEPNEWGRDLARVTT
ncbi:MAG: FAD-dependent oxidoreductase, partial [Archaeoglobaceae archaeon]